jgi:hypothetical protein
MAESKPTEKELMVPKSFKDISIKKVPMPVFQAWLRFRIDAADQLFKGWRDIPCRRARIDLLDVAVTIKSMMN